MTNRIDRIRVHRRRFVQGAAALTAVAATPLRFAGAQAAALKIGVLLPTTGHLAAAGQNSRKGIEVAIKKINDAGGVGGAKLEMMFVDTESKAENGRTAAEKLIREGANILVGAWDSGTSVSAAQAAEQNKVPLFVNIASARQLTEQGYKYIFRNFPSGAMLVGNAIRLIPELVKATNTPIKTAVFMHVNDTFGTAVADGVRALWPRANTGIEIVETMAYDPQTRSLAAEITKAKATNADILMPVTRINDAILMVRELIKQDWNPKGVISPGSPSFYQKEFSDALGKHGDFTIVNVPWYNPKTKATQEALAAFKQAYPRDRFDLEVGYSYEAILAVAEAFKMARSNNPEALREALTKIKLEDHVMVGGPIQFDEKGQNPNIGGAMLQIRGAEPRVVLPADIAEMAPVFPIPPWSARG